MSLSSQLIIAVFASLLLGGCATARLVDTQAANLMPNPAASKVLAKYAGAEWAQKPYLKPISLFCMKNVEVKFSEIRSATYAVLLNTVILRNWQGSAINIFTDPYSCDKKVFRISVSDDSEAQQITEALIALGAPINGFVKSY